MKFEELVESGGTTTDWFSSYAKLFPGFYAPSGSLAGQQPPAQPVTALGSDADVGTYASSYYGEAVVEVSGSGLALKMGPTGMRTYPLRHWSGNTFVFELSGENAPPGSVSRIDFKPNNSGVSHSMAFVEYHAEDIARAACSPGRTDARAATALVHARSTLKRSLRQTSRYPDPAPMHSLIEDDLTGRHRSAPPSVGRICPMGCGVATRLTPPCSCNNVFGLLRHLGHETAGALSFVAAGQVPAEQEPLRRPLPFDELQARIDNRANEPFNRWDGKVRMSIAGPQDKLLVAIEERDLFLVDGALSSTHILKPEPARGAAPFMVANEHFCMQLAHRISMRRWKAPGAAQVSILRVPSPVLSIERFDRRRTPGGVERLHIIDGCQALDWPVSAKYARNVGDRPDVRHIRDGASFEKLGKLRPGFVEPALAMQRLVLWAVTTLLLGNADSHGKNIAFFVDRTGLTPPPRYDLVSVVQYATFHHDLAMAFGDEFELDAVRSFAIADFCVRRGVERRYVARELTRLCAFALEEAPAQGAGAAYTGEEAAFVQTLARCVATRAKALSDMARDIPKFAADNYQSSTSRSSCFGCSETRCCDAYFNATPAPIWASRSMISCS